MISSWAKIDKIFAIKGRTNFRDLLKILGVNLNFEKFGIPMYPEDIVSASFQLIDRVVYIKFKQYPIKGKLELKVEPRTAHEIKVNQSIYMQGMFGYFSYKGKSNVLWCKDVFGS